jgi:hypothetical protein
MKVKVCVFTDSPVSRNRAIIKQDYDLYRSHYIALQYICRYFRQDVIYEYKDIDYEVEPKVSYSARIIPVKPDNIRLGIILHSKVTEYNKDILIEFISKCENIIYYNSDPEFNTSELVKDPMLLNYIFNNNDLLTELFRSKLKYIITGLKDQEFLLRNKLCTTVDFVPQLLNNQISTITSNKYYDIFMISNSSKLKNLVNELEASGLRVFILCPYSYRYNDNASGAYICGGNGTDYDMLINLVSQCKYYLGTNTYWADSIEDQDNYYVNQCITSKLFESFYGNTIPIPAAVRRKDILKYIQEINPIYDEVLMDFKLYMRKTFDIKNYKQILDKVCQSIKEY